MPESAFSTQIVQILCSEARLKVLKRKPTERSFYSFPFKFTRDVGSFVVEIADISGLHKERLHLPYYPLHGQVQRKKI